MRGHPILEARIAWLRTEMREAGAMLSAMREAREVQEKAYNQACAVTTKWQEQAEKAERERDVEREARVKAEAERDEARSNTVSGLSHRVLTSYGAPNHPGLTLLGRIEALADSRDRVIVARKQAEKERDEWKAKAEIKNPSECGWDTLGSRCLAAEAERDAEREKVKTLREALKEPERCCETCTDTTCTLRCCDGHPDRNFPYWQGMPLEERVKRVLAATEGRDATPPEHDCAAWKQMKKRVDEIRDELGPERVPAAAVERIMKLEDNLEALRSYATQTGCTQCVVPNVPRRLPVSEWPKIERDAWLLNLCEAHWDGMMWHPRGGERPNRTYCPLCQEYGYTCQGCPLVSCQNAHYSEAVGAFNLLLLFDMYEDARASHEKPWREKAGAMIEHIREMRRGIVEGGKL